MTRKLFLIAGVAGLAMAAPAQAERGGHRDRAQATDSGSQQRAQRPQRAERQQMQRAERPQRAERAQVQRAERPQRMERQRVQRAERPARMERQQIQRAERPNRVERQRVQRAERPQRIERQHIQRAERPARLERQRVQHAERPARVERQRIQRAERPARVERQRIQQAERRNVDRFDRRQAFVREARAEPNAVQSRLASNSPRSIERLIQDREIRPMRFRDNRNLIAIGDRISPTRYSSVVPTIYRARYYDTPDYYYRYDNDLGYLYRVGRRDNLVSALIPLFGGYGIGDPWPRTYYSSYVPAGYQPYYYDTPDYYYRYDGNGIYQIDAGTQLITALVALVTGQSLGIGQQLPAAYSAYNVPYAYRDRYYDSGNDWYRYANGVIYRVDPYNRVIEEAIPVYA